MPVHLWMLSWSEEDGFSLPSNDDMLLMISMVLTAGFLTDPATPGVEALSVRKGKRQESPVLLEFITSVETESGTMNQKRIINEQVGIGSIGYIKGLKRSLAALAIVAAIVVLDCRLYTSDAADDLMRVERGGRRTTEKQSKATISIGRRRSQ